MFSLLNLTLKFIKAIRLDIVTQAFVLSSLDFVHL